mmetsp:Transcript_3570/g.11599  ORF Transcript_3570/g.11599 Transcript_3570/m.11599 type:complete len:292 (+) Transcript_3570:485-1360(+)
MSESRMRLRVTHSASWMARLASSTIMAEPPRTKMVTALELAHSSRTRIFLEVVPSCCSRMMPHDPSFSGAHSSNRGTMRAPVAMAINSISTPPTQRTAGNPFCRSRWLASSSKPHWHNAMLAPDSLTSETILVKYSSSSLLMSSYCWTDPRSTLCLVLGLGGSNGQVKMQILASRTSLGICGCDISLSRMMPRTSAVSSRRPPTLPVTVIRSRFTSPRSRSATANTASTHVCASDLRDLDTIFESSEVMADLTSGARSLAALSQVICSAISRRWATATSHAASNPSEILIG